MPARTAVTMIAKTHAIVLRVVPFSETSHMVTWLTPDQGRLVTVIKGAQRPKSPFLGQYDLFYTCELLYYTRDRNGVHIAREATPIHFRPRFRSDWKACVTASYVCDMVHRTSFDGPHGSDMFSLTTDTLNFANSHPATMQVVLWFELRLLDLLGVAPQLTGCPLCGGQVKASSHPPTLSPAGGGIICGTCARTQPLTRRVSPDIVAILRAWQRAATPRAAFQTRCTTEQLLQLAELVGLFADYHLDISLSSRYITMQMLFLD